MLRSIILIILLVLASGLSAQNRFQVDWPVEDRSSAEQSRALAGAFREVILRSSGTSRAFNNDYLVRQLDRVNTYVKTFQYVTSIDEEQNESLLLRVDFEASSVLRLLQESAVPMWSGSLPVSLVWLAYEENFNRQLLNDATTIELADLLKTEFKRRGLPILLPLNDLEDTSKVSVSDIWGRFAEPIQNASIRYPSEAIVAGRVVDQTNGWRGSFWLEIQGQQRLIEIEEETAQEVISKMTDWIGEELCQVFCVTDNFQADNQQSVIIQNVGSFNRYRQLLDYLGQLSAIREVDVVAVRGRQVQLNLELVGGVEPLRQALALDNRLSEITDETLVDEAIKAMEKTKIEESNEGLSLSSEVNTATNSGEALEDQANSQINNNNPPVSSVEQLLEQQLSSQINSQLPSNSANQLNQSATTIVKPLVYQWRR